MTPLFRLRRFLDEAPEPPKAPGCELCGAPFFGRHWHVVDTAGRRLLCACRPCFLLFTHAGAAQGKFRSVAERVCKLPDSPLEAGPWQALEIPVGTAFFVPHAGGTVSAFYPSPAGATESGLALDAWRELTAAYPALGSMEPDIEALLVCRRRERSDGWIVPVDACYELVGRLRRHWKGFEGGPEAWREIDEFCTSLDQASAGVERSCA